MLLPTFIEDIKKYILFSIKKYFLCFLSSILLILSFAPFDLFFFAWVSLLPLFLFLYNAPDYKTVFKGGLIFGFFYFLGNVYWIYHSLYYYGSVPLFLSYIIVILLSLYLALYPALFSLIYKNLLRNNLPTSLYAPFIWVSLEVLRTYFLTGFPWALLGYSQYKFLIIAQIVDITGIYGLSYLIVLFNCFIFDFWIFRKKKTLYPLLPYYSIISSTILVITIFVLCIVYGLNRLDSYENNNKFRVAVIQGSIPQNEKWDFNKINEILNIYKNLTVKANAYNPKLIVWPETAIPFIFEKNRYLTEDLIKFVKEQNVYLLFGSIMERQKDKYTNSAILIDPNGTVAYYYDKIHLVPFGEYVPLRKILFFIDKLTVGIGDYQPGSSYNVAITPFGKFATLICYEIIFPGQVRKFYNKGGNFIVNITNDGWFGNTAGPYQHFSIAVFRAIENRKPLIRSANSGISGFIDSSGRIINKTNLFERKYFVSDIQINNKISFYTKYGDIFAYICIVFSLIFLIGNINFGGKKWLHLRI
ncbi:MAG: apolipoprotein N-acyltransferase [Thermodesulfovibrio sp.]|uniref:apolipoprotein N-acyltransferase n=1 Tax=Thermodesulfovibrio sp. 1176 TaxID=3043424 RepID=UPI002482BD97|nr:apolipoprotein N-acyltransferase [Thermodesulfovibrio sp. 1176]MDI1471824.1 apolipoprotein N-acyltransferase [Thermodesulfovibrio sp. 1176]MDI6713714.1 apolipoprotein N-acyltransferase [Thermodesulfovibrio sp.]